MTHRVEEDLHALISDDPFIPPKGNICVINSLPVELLSHIFKIGTTDTDGESALKAIGAVGSSTTRPPFETLVSHVCHHWREVALSTPSLWTTIMIGPEVIAPLEGVSTLLERSQDLLIDIYVNCIPPYHVHRKEWTKSYPPSDPKLKLLYSLLVPHIHRWRTVQVLTSEYCHIYEFLSAVSDPSIPTAPRLTTLKLYYYEELDDTDVWYSTWSNPRILFSGSAPCLTNIVTWGVNLDWNQPWIASASHLTSFEIADLPKLSSPSWAHFADILGGAPALEKLSLRKFAPCVYRWAIQSSPGSATTKINFPVQLSKLTVLVLASQSATDAVELFRRLYLPALTHLELLDSDRWDYVRLVEQLVGPATVVSSVPFSQRSRSLLSQLESFKVARLSCSDHRMNKLYAELCNLTSLHLSMSHLPSFFLSFLGEPCTVPGLGDTWLPRLAMLYISGSSGVDIRRVVQKRKEAGKPLRALYIDGSCDMDGEDMEWLEENVEIFRAKSWGRGD